MAYLQKYIDYIRNTGLDPLPIEYFDEDWDPIGPKVRRDLVNKGFVSEVSGGLSLTP